MTLTREQLIDKAKPRYKPDVEIEGLGKVGIQAVSELRGCLRDDEFYDEKGYLKPSKRADARAAFVIDQICTAPGEPMFTKGDLELVKGFDELLLSRLWEEIARFNNGLDAKKKAESNGSSTRLAATTV